MIDRPKDWWLSKAESEPEVSIAAGAPTPNAFAMEYRPTLRERFWRKMGFHHHHPEMSEEGEKFPGWIMLQSVSHIDWRDRLRILVSGRILFKAEIRCDVPVGETISAAALSVIAPGERL